MLDFPDNWSECLSDVDTTNFERLLCNVKYFFCDISRSITTTKAFSKVSHSLLAYNLPSDTVQFV